MNLSTFLFGVLSSVSFVTAASRYIAKPFEEIDVIEVNPIVSQLSMKVPRYPRQTDNYVSAMVSGVRHNDFKNLISRISRPESQILNYVDFAAHSGKNGAYSWHAEFPAHH